MNWLAMLGIFAKPVGAIINKGISSVAAASIAYSVAKGNPLGDVTGVVSMLALAASTLISGFAATQGVQIPVINEDPSNGVKVVASNTTAPTVNAPLKVAR